MKYFLISLLVVPVMLSATLVLAQWGGEQDYPFAEQQQRAEFKQMETKQEVDSLKPRVNIHPGPEGGPGESLQLLKDRLQVLQENRKTAVQQNKSPEEIAQLDAQIKSVQQQLTAYH
jgi:hypothetical protein